MVTQRGSILAAVTGMTMVLSLAAASMLLVASNAGSEEDRAFQRAGCYLDAESGLMMGAGWLRVKGADYIKTDQGWGGTPHSLPPIQLENGSTVTVKIMDNGTFKTVVSRAVKGSESAQFSWDIDTVYSVGPLTLKLTNWRSP